MNLHIRSNYRLFFPEVLYLTDHFTAASISSGESRTVVKSKTKPYVLNLNPFAAEETS
jgi:hypothetical protein